MSRSSCFVPAIVLSLAAVSAYAEVKVPNVFSSHMVLQQEKPIVIWGSADPGEQVTVAIGAARQQAKASDAGQWRVTLPAMKADGQARTVTISGTNTITLEDVLLGEVWICSGQSNMEMGIGPCANGKNEIAAANYPQIRLLQIEKTIAAAPQSDIKATWQVCSPETAGKGGWGGFSAAGYYFGRELHKTLNVPVGLIQSAWGGTRIEPWTTPDGFGSIPALKSIYDQVLLADVRSDLHKQTADRFFAETETWLSAGRKAVQEQAPIPAMPTFPQGLAFKQDSQTPTGLYNAMIHPLVPMGIRGAIWYQGESNAGEGKLYTTKMQALIGGWRKVFNQGDFPFYYVQIAPFEYGNQSPNILPEFWEAQAAAMQIPNTGMAGTMDISNLKDIHPTNKQDVGHRLAVWALARTYGKTELEYCGPTFRSLTKEGSKLRIAFDHIGGGLVSRDGKPLTWFEVIDAETGGFVPADAQIEGSNVVLSAKNVSNPVAARFGWHKLAEPNLSNKAGLPALPFRAGDVPKRDALSLINEASEYQLVYDLDLAKLSTKPAYDVDNHAKIAGRPARVAYYVELQSGDGSQQHVFVSMDAFTDDLAKIAVPTYGSGASFQMPVANMNVYSNVPSIATGTGIKDGFIEFWPNNYGPQNTKNVAGASAAAFDFGDGIGEPADGYGCMQVHNVGAKQTVFAINNFKAAGGADLGIGNRMGQQNTDWTFSANAGSYSAKRLRVFVKMK